MARKDKEWGRQEEQRIELQKQLAEKQVITLTTQGQTKQDLRNAKTNQHSALRQQVQLGADLTPPDTPSQN